MVCWLALVALVARLQLMAGLDVSLHLTIMLFLPVDQLMIWRISLELLGDCVV